MNALEEEVLRLRERESALNEVASYWKQRALTAINRNNLSSIGIQNLQFGPGMFLWAVSDSFTQSQYLFPSPQPPIHSSTTTFSQLAVHDALLNTLLQNCE